MGQALIETKAIINGNNPGRIFVDHTDSPQSGLIWLGSHDGFIFIGNEQNEIFNHELNDFINRVIEPEAKQAGLTWFEGIGNDKKWNRQIEMMFKHRNVASWNQKVFTLSVANYSRENELKIDSAYTVLKISKVFDGSNMFQNIDFVEAKILSFWDSLDSFFQKGIGYCIVHQNRIVSMCLSVYVAENVHSIDIETLEAHQGRKLAQKAAHCFVTECFAHGSTPYWDCMEDNKPSIVIAENIGFTNVFNYVGDEFPFLSSDK